MQLERYPAAASVTGKCRRCGLPRIRFEKRRNLEDLCQLFLG